MERTPRRRRGAIRSWLTGIAAVVLVAGLGGYVLWRRLPGVGTPLPEGVAPPAPGAPGDTALPGTEPLSPPADTVPEAVPERPLPSLAESDPLVRELAGGLSLHSVPSAWLSTTGLIERFVAVVDNVVEGESPRPHLGFLAPKAKFRTVSRAGGVYIDARSYARYDAIADVIGALDARRSVELYRKLQPLCDEAYRALGHPQGDFDTALTRAIQVLLATPEVEGEVELRPKVISYAFVDPRLERLNDAQKHLLRMGPRNVHLITGQLRTLAAALGAAEPDQGGATPLPPPSAGADAGRARDP